MNSQNFKFFVKKSPIHGRGVFATQDIKAGNVFYTIPLEKVSKTPKRNWARIGNEYVGDEKLLNWLNHSCQPNVQISLKPKACLIAVSDIRSGEEITCDYNQTEINGKKYPCNCQSKNCRGYFLAEK